MKHSNTILEIYLFMENIEQHLDTLNCIPVYLL